jgi:hypothetical protein
MSVSQLEAVQRYQTAPAGGVQLTWNSTTHHADLPEALHQQLREIASQIQAQTRMRESLRLHIITPPAGWPETSAGEIGVRAHITPGAGPEPATVDVLFNGDSGLTREVVTALPIGELRQRLVRLLRVYMVEGCGKDTFTSWSRGLSDQQLRSQMGISE